ncbi:MAG: epoxyqueuosine reductase QueH [Kiritimatiellae bacterium]|nr:epoxyqueuosine reductase QueH [Kiritimatiellia bacterium]
MNVLLHTCCGPCASHCVWVLKTLGHKVTMFYSNANIWPPEEFARRREGVEKLARLTKTELIVDEPDNAAWEETVAKGFETEPERGARCARCFRFNLSRTRDAMNTLDFEAFTTSLTVSPYKPSPLILGIGRELGEGRFLEENFKKKNGYLHSLELSREYGLYRQQYCGCRYSIR